LGKKQIKVSWGKISFSWDKDGVSFLSLPEEESEESLYPSEETSSDLETALIDYFQGKPVSFAFKTNLTGLSNFQQEVLEAAKMVPYGETRSYLWIAKEIGSPKAARAVGGALGRNPIAILIP